MKKILIVLSLTAIMVIAFAGPAQAHLLSFKRAAKVARAVAERDCDNDPRCTGYAAFKNDCRRASAHRVRCFALNVGTDASGNYGCSRPVLVKMRKNNRQLIFVTGNRECFPIRR